MEYSRQQHSVGDNFWHVEWCPKYRYQMFGKDKYKTLAETCVRQAATEHQIFIHELQVMPDHLHAVISIPNTMSISQAKQFLKGRSSYLFFQHHEKARLRYPQGHLWSKGTFATSVGYADLPTTLAYVRNQEAHHLALAQGNRTLP